MKKVFSKLFLFYSAILAVFITVSGLLTLKDVNGALFQLAFLPVTLFFLWAVVKEIVNVFKKDKKKTTDYAVSLGGKKTEIVLGVLVFAFLTGLAAKNIFLNKSTTSEQKNGTIVNSQPELTDKSQGIVFDKNATESAKKAQIVVIKITDGSSSVNLREGPSTTTKIVSTAKDGDTFDFEEEISGWYKIKLEDQSIAYITSNYAEIKNK